MTESIRSGSAFESRRCGKPSGSDPGKRIPYRNDATIPVYADDAATLLKQARAISPIGEHQRDNSLIVSLQVLQEYFAALVDSGPQSVHMPACLTNLFNFHGKGKVHG